MKPELEALARRAVACPRWRWMPGMLVTGPNWINSARLCDVDPASVFPDLWEYRGYVSGPRAASRLADTDQWADKDAYPDLTDFATLGCLLALVREAWGDPYLCCVGDRETGWRLDGYAAVEDIHSYRSEAEALVAALEVGP